MGFNLPLLLRRRRSGADAYAIGGASPELVAAFTLASDGTTAGEYFRKASSATTFDGLFTFSRSGTATYFDSNGTLQTAADGVARRNAYYYNAAWLKGGLRFESAAATNLLTHSEDFTNAVWLTGGLNSVISASATAAPTGGAYKLADNNLGGTGLVGVAVVVTVATTTTYTFSVHCKADGLSWVSLQGISLTTPANGGVWFDLSTGSIGTENTGYTGHIEDCGNGWYRCAITFTTDAADTSGQLRIYVSDGDADTSVDRDNTSSILVAGAQFEAGSVPSSYAPTTGSTVTRAAETLSIAGADTPANTTAMSISMKGLMTYADNGTAAQETFLRWHADANNFITLDLDTDSTATGEVNANQSTAGTLDTVVAGAEYNPGVNVAFNIASRHTSGAVNVAKDGTAATADTTPTALADLSSTALTPGYDFSGFISELRVWGSDIGDSGIEGVTS